MTQTVEEKNKAIVCENHDRPGAETDMTELLDAAIAAHGGMERWSAVRSVDITFNFAGGLLDLKGYPGHRRPSASLDVATPRTVFQRLGDESDDRWIFTPNRVWIERRDGTVVEERAEPRAAFAGHVRETPWDHLHLTYFHGYAVWNYLTTLRTRRSNSSISATTSC